MIHLFAVNLFRQSKHEVRGFSLILIDVMTVFAQEHGHEFNGDHALQELYDYVRRYQDQVSIVHKLSCIY